MVMAFVRRHDRLLLRIGAAMMFVAGWLSGAPLRAQTGPPAPAATISALPPASQPAPEAHPRVLDVRLTGNRAITRDRVLANIGTRINQPFDQAIFSADVRKLVGKSWFVHVEPTVEKVPGGVVIHLRVVERPTLQYVRYLGWKKIKPKTLAKQTEIKKGDSLDPFAVEDAARKLETYYQTKGFNDVKVEVLEGNKPTDRGAVFLINEGKVQKIWKVRFEGNSIASDGRLKTQIETKPPLLWLFKGYVDREKIDADVERLIDYYRGLGFFKAQIGRDYTWDEDESWMTLTFYVNEGPQYEVRNVSFMGNKIYGDSVLFEGLKLHPGDFFNREKSNNDIGYIKDVYGANGYVFADVNRELLFDLEPGQLDIVYKLTEGEQCLVGDINVHIAGDNPHTRLKTAINRIGLRPGDVVDIRKIRASEARLKRSQIFNVDPSKGDIPRIVLSPPNSAIDSDEERSSVAEGGGNSRTTRGQSPDPPRATRSGVRYQSPDAGYGGQAVNPIAPGGYAPQQTNPYAAPNTTTYPAGTTNSQTVAPNGYPPPPNNPYAAAASGTSPAPVNRYAAQTAGQPSPTGTYLSQVPNDGSTQPPIVSGPPPGSIYPPNYQQNGVGQPPYAAQGSYPPGFGAGPPDLPGGSLLPNPTPEGIPLPDDRPRIPVDIYLNEAQTGRFMFGAGVNSNAGLVGSIILDEQNFDWRRIPTSWEDFRSGRAFRGAGQRFRLEAAPGTEVSRYMFNFADPYLFDTPVSFGLSGFYFQRFYRDWTEQRAGGRTSLGYQLTPDLSGSLAFRAEDVRVSNPRVDPTTVPPLEEVLGHTQMYGFTGTVAWDTRDSTFLPTQGRYVSLAVAYTMGTFQFPTYTVDYRRFFMLRERPDGSGRHVLSIYNQFGITGSDTPMYERFFAGGFSTLRGFQFRGASPQINTVEVGGDFQNLSSVEYMFPVTADDMLRAVVFVDFGTVEETVTIDWDNFRVAPGIGMRISLPALGPGPIAVDFAVPVAYADTDIRQLVQFFVGYSR